MKKTTTVLAAMLAATALADRTANRSWVEGNFVNKTNEWRLAERRHALLLVDLNAETGGRWRSFELKASTNNFARTGGSEEANMCFWSCSDEADGYTDASVPVSATRAQDRMRLYWLTAHGAAGRDGRAWSRIANTLELFGAYPRRLAVLVSPELCVSGGWLGEECEEAVWSYARCDAAGPERDAYGAVVWHPVQPSRWYRNLPAWAKQEN